MKRVIKNVIYKIVACVLMCSMLAGCTGNAPAESSNEGQQGITDATTTGGAEGTTTVAEATTDKIETINLWYTNDDLTPYLTNCAIHFREVNGVGVNLNLVSSIDYIENIYQGTKEGNVADVYIANTELLEKAYLAGLAAENTAVTSNTFNYPQVALDASTYHGKLIGYPLYFDTTFFMYNKDYVEAPATFEDIITFSENYMGEYEKIETILQWDVHDLFFSYGFVGAYLNFGGQCGDDASIIDIDNTKVIDSLVAFKQINQALYFDSSDSNYEDVLQDFLDGKILYTMGSTADLEEIIVTDINYGICTMPDIDGELDTKAVSINYAVVVNPYSTNKAMAEKLAIGLSLDHAEEFYEYAKRLPSRKLKEYPNDEWAHIAEQYENTAILPKLMATTNYWLELEVALNYIWDKELGEEAELEVDESIYTEEEVEVLKKEYLVAVIRGYVREEINKLQALMEQQIN